MIDNNPILGAQGFVAPPVVPTAAPAAAPEVTLDVAAAPAAPAVNGDRNGVAAQAPGAVAPAVDINNIDLEEGQILAGMMMGLVGDGKVSPKEISAFKKVLEAFTGSGAPQGPRGGAAPAAPAAPAAAAPAAPAAAHIGEVPQVGTSALTGPAGMLPNVNIDAEEGRILAKFAQQLIADGKVTPKEIEAYKKVYNLFAAAEAEKPGSGQPVKNGEDAWKVGDKPLSGNKFSSVGDPHETSGDGLKFDNMKRGDFVKLRSASGDFELQTRQEPWKPNPQATVNTAAAAKLGKDVVAYDGKTNKLTVNGKETTLAPGQEMKLPDGGSVKRGANGDIEMTSSKGDKVKVQDKGEYIDVTGEVSGSRKDGEVRGSLGAFDTDTDTSNDLVGRDGKQHTMQNLDAFLEDWRVKGNESLFGGPQGSGAAEDIEFNKLNKNGDAYLDGNEITDDIRAYDTDKDGKITIDEFRLGKSEGAARKQDEADFKKADITEGGWLSGTEVKGFEKYDADKDGEITKEEFMKGRAAERAAKLNEQNAEKDFMLKDINNDNYLDGNEMTPEMKKYWDKDQNGRLTKEEYMAGVRGERPVAGAQPAAAQPAAGAGTFVPGVGAFNPLAGERKREEEAR